MIFLAVLTLIASAMLLGVSICLTADDKEQWPSMLFSILCVIGSTLMVIDAASVNEQQIIRDFEAGKYKKEVVYKTKKVDNHLVETDSLVTYKLIK